MRLRTSRLKNGDEFLEECEGEERGVERVEMKILHEEQLIGKE